MFYINLINQSKKNMKNKTYIAANISAYCEQIAPSVSDT